METIDIILLTAFVTEIITISLSYADMKRKERKEKIKADAAKRKEMIREQFVNDYKAFYNEMHKA